MKSILCFPSTLPGRNLKFNLFVLPDLAAMKGEDPLFGGGVRERSSHCSAAQTAAAMTTVDEDDTAAAIDSRDESQLSAKGPLL